MKKTLILAFIVLPFFAFAQCHSSVGFFGGIDYNYRTIPQSVLGVGLEGRHEDIGRLKTRFGVNFINRASEKVYFKTGLRIANIGYTQVNLDEYQIGDAFTLSNTERIDLMYMEVPFMFGVNLGHGDISAFVELGVSPHVFLNAGNDASSKFNTSYNTLTSQYFNTMNISANLSVGVDIRVTHDVVSFIAPTFRYHLNSSSREVSGERLFSMGIECGVRKRINEYH